MRKILSLVTIITAVVAVSTTANAQVNATAVSGATIVAPISITKRVDLNFGNVAVSTAAGTVILATNGDRTKTGGVTLPNQIGTVTAASFDIEGEGDFTYSIGLPSGAVTLAGTDGNATTLTVDNFESLPSGTGKLVLGKQTLLVGGVLNVAGGQKADTYTNATGLVVTVNYN